MTSREIIRRVLEHDSPPRIGFSYSNFDGRTRLRDIASIGPRANPDFDPNRREDGLGGELWEDEWGCTWRRLIDWTKGGEVVEPAVTCREDLETYEPPDLDNPERYEHGPEVREANRDRYLLGSLTGCCFNRARYLPTFGGYLEACAADPEFVNDLNRMVSDIVIGQVDIYADIGCDGVFFCEDWGTQKRLLVAPGMWDRMFKWTFERLIDRCHFYGMTVWMHSCGYVCDIVPPLVELGMDLFQFDQPELHGLDRLGELSDRTTFWLPVDIQVTLPTGDEELIRSRAREMVEKMGRGGGLITKDYGDNASIGVNPLWQQWGYEAFKQHGVFDPEEAGLDAAEL
ncbi:MAG: uroporphyrinogen decarboxylase family protein [Armatimonadota bacterium]|nr:uroporphyrinogen decarboxylase family protein [Armatimonadota bacterium]